MKIKSNSKEVAFLLPLPICHKWQVFLPGSKVRPIYTYVQALLSQSNPCTNVKPILKVHPLSMLSVYSSDPSINLLIALVGKFTEQDILMERLYKAYPPFQSVIAAFVILITGATVIFQSIETGLSFLVVIAIVFISSVILMRDRLFFEKKKIWIQIRRLSISDEIKCVCHKADFSSLQINIKKCNNGSHQNAVVLQVLLSTLEKIKQLQAQDFRSNCTKELQRTARWK